MPIGRLKGKGRAGPGNGACVFSSLRTSLPMDRVFWGLRERRALALPKSELHGRPGSLVSDGSFLLIEELDNLPYTEFIGELDQSPTRVCPSIVNAEVRRVKILKKNDVR